MKSLSMSYHGEGHSLNRLEEFRRISSDFGVWRWVNLSLLLLMEGWQGAGAFDEPYHLGKQLVLLTLGCAILVVRVGMKFPST